MAAAFRREMGARLALALALVAAAWAAAALADGRALGRLAAMAEVAGTNASNEERFARWRQGFSVFLEHPVLGVGPAAVPNVPRESLPPGIRELPWSERYHSHQVFITVMAESGLLGLAAFLALHLLPLARVLPALRSRRPQTRLWAWGALCVFLQLALNGLVDNVFTLKPLMYVYWTVTATALYLAEQERAALGRARRAARPPVKAADAAGAA
jgi:O-antigen ligase